MYILQIYNCGKRILVSISRNELSRLKNWKGSCHVVTEPISRDCLSAKNNRIVHVPCYVHIIVMYTYMYIFVHVRTNLYANIFDDLRSKSFDTHTVEHILMCTPTINCSADDKLPTCEFAHRILRTKMKNKFKKLREIRIRGNFR